jgi:hypothetical protein
MTNPSPNLHPKRRCATKYNVAEKNGMWKGDNVGYVALHQFIKLRKPKPKVCESCSREVRLDLANISGEYKRDVNDFIWLCRKCHTKMDWKNGVRKHEEPFKKCPICYKLWRTRHTCSNPNDKKYRPTEKVKEYNKRAYYKTREKILAHKREVYWKKHKCPRKKT